MRAVQFSCNVALSGNKFRTPARLYPCAPSIAIGIANPQTELADFRD